MNVRPRAIFRSAAVALPLFCAPAAAAETLTPEIIAAVRDVSDPDVSSDGSRVAYTLDQAGSPRSTGKDIWVVETSGEAEPEPLVQTPGDDAMPAWSPDGEWLAYLSSGPEADDGKGLFVVRKDGRQRRRLSPDGLEVRAFEWSDEGDRIAFIADGLWISDLGTHALERAGGTGANVLDLTWAPDGERIAVNEGNRLEVIHARTGVELATLTDRVSKPWSRRRIFDWSPDGRRILFARLAEEEVSPAGIGFWLAVISADGGEPRPVLKFHPGTITQAVWAPDSRHLLAQSFERTRSRIIRVDVASETFEVLVDDIFEEKSFSVDGTGREVVWLASTYESPVDVWFRGSTGRTRRLTSSNEQLSGLAAGDVRQVRWTGGAGQPLYGVLVLPPGCEAGTPCPTIVQLHGGPHFAWWEGWLGSWHDWAQLLAANGYAVFLPNPRGSTGRGLEFSLANVNDIAKGPFEDVMLGVDHLIDIGIADPERLGIGGWSYGGYLTAWAITQTDRFKAAVVGAGISRLTKRSPMLLKEYYGNIDVRHRYDHLARVSPESFLESVTTPTLVIHGREDGKISYLQAVELHDGLAELGVETEIILYEGEGHGVVERANRIHMLGSIVSWYDQYLRIEAQPPDQRPGI